MTDELKITMTELGDDLIKTDVTDTNENVTSYEHNAGEPPADLIQQLMDHIGGRPNDRNK